MYIYNICALCLRGVLLGIPYLVVRWWWSRLSLSLSLSHTPTPSPSLSHTFLLFDTVRYDIIRYSPADPKSRWGRHSPTLSPHETTRPASVSFFFFLFLLPLENIIIRTPEKSALFICFLLYSVFFCFLPSFYTLTSFFFLFSFSYNCKLPTHTFKRSNSAPEGFGITKISYSISTS